MPLALWYRANIRDRIIRPAIIEADEETALNHPSTPVLLPAQRRTETGDHDNRSGSAAQD